MTTHSPSDTRRDTGRPISCAAAGLAPLLLLAASGVAHAGSPLPKTMLGTWAPEIAACEDKAGETSDSRVAITPGSVEYFASIWSVRSWQRQADLYRGRAQVAEEGDDKPQPGRTPLALRLLPDGKIEIHRGKQWDTFVKCPRDVPVR